MDPCWWTLLRRVRFKGVNKGPMRLFCCTPLCHHQIDKFAHHSFLVGMLSLPTRLQSGGSGHTDRAMPHPTLPSNSCPCTIRTRLPEHTHRRYDHQKEIAVLDVLENMHHHVIWERQDPGRSRRLPAASGGPSRPKPLFLPHRNPRQWWVVCACGIKV